jgi:arylsulfatase A-like enzyme
MSETLSMLRILASLAASAIAIFAVAASPPPNVVLILADDLGYGDLGCYGCRDIPTPNLDRIAAEGARFTRAYVYNVCSPTRAAVHTGRYAERSGVTTALMGGNAKGFAGVRTLPAMLGAAGYRTGLVGKWHLGYSGEVVPLRKGYDEFFGLHGGKIDYYRHTDSTQDGKHELYEGEKEVFLDGYATELFAARAVKFIGEHKEKRFFLNLSFNAPHFATKKGTFQAPQEYLRKVNAPENPDGTRAGYAAMVNCMDDAVGRVLTALDEFRIRDNTMVIFLSDNGSELVGSNAPWSGGKHSNKEGGIRVPMMVRWPARIARGLVLDDAVHAIDIAPTVLAATGTPVPEGVEFDGINLLPLFTGKEKLPERGLFFPPSAITRGPWKMNGDKLHNLASDPGESRDLSSTNPEVAVKLREEMEKWRTELGIKRKIRKK